MEQVFYSCGHQLTEQQVVTDRLELVGERVDGKFTINSPCAECARKYNPRQARFELGVSLLMQISQLYTQVGIARNMEMSFASNETVNPVDFDRIKAQLEHLMSLAFALREDNKPVT